ncbi:DNA polymerase, partial [Streptomyces nanshensis]
MDDSGRGQLLHLPTRERRSVGWAELHVHSSFSFLQGASSVEELAAHAAGLGIEVLAVTDRDGLYAARRLASAARDHNLGTVYGAELQLPPPYGPVVVLACDLAGFRQLATVLSAAQLAGSKGAPVYDVADLSAAARGGHWAVLTGCPSPEQAAAASAAELDDAHAAARYLEQLADLVGRDALHVELIDHALPTDAPRNDALHAAAGRLGLPVVASNAVHYAAPA